MSTFAAFREATGLVRPPAAHGCVPVEIVPGLWTAHFHDVLDLDALRRAAPPVTCVVNAGTDKCPTAQGSYGNDVRVVLIEGLLDDPDPLKKIDAMPEGPKKAAARTRYNSRDVTLYSSRDECAGDAKAHFAQVNEVIDLTRAAGGATLVHCHASLSRSVAFILAYLMRTQRLTSVEAARLMKAKWGATWPNDTFAEQLLEYERELAYERAAARVGVGK